MTRQQLEHVIRAAAANAGVRDVVIVGSQAILGAFPDAPAELLASMEANVFPKNDPKLSDVIDGAMGEASLFHRTFGYYAHGVDDHTAIVPKGWQERLIKVENVNTGGAVGWCLEPHDLAVSKLVAGRENDVSFVDALVRRKLVKVDLIRQRLIDTILNSAIRAAAEARLTRYT